MPSEPKGDWNYHPDLPLADPSIFRWPPDAGFFARWFAHNWLMLSERVMLLIVAIAAWYLLYPSLEDSKTFAVGWIAQTYVINLAIMFFSAGALHWYFYIIRGQAKILKFDGRDQVRNNRTFKFADQVRDNMFWTLASGVTAWTIFQVVTVWMMANGYAPTITFASNPIWFVAALILMPIWSAFHFYWAHRLLHVPFFYTRFHSLHHRNINIGPWSGMAMHPFEAMLYFSTICIHWIVATHPVHLIFHLIYQGPGAAMSHTGYEDLLIKDKRRLALGTFYHTLHHRFFECNYGNQEMPWDRWFGTFHDGTDEATKQTRDRKKRMYAK
ncbi:MAG: sterol desaturase family protein [Paracoccaceae bacterium]|nr:sterol desaturase family protein [Paracoccaceae bacterium]